ncbi:MAG: hypothetical protein HQL49_08640 [Gammaproteobacteria bacterium]|nr:hypothetical protein [Gammaproteobacteria bacterium]
MSQYEIASIQQAQKVDAEIRRLEQKGVEVLSSYDPLSSLHSKIHNPVTEGIDEG